MIVSTEAQLEELLATPSAAEVDCLRRLSGDVMILGAGGKMGPSLARRIKQAADTANVKRRVIAVSRFSSLQSREALTNAGIETISCDLLDRTQVNQLPDCENIYFLAGRKFGSTERTDLTWASNVYAPALVAERFHTSRIVAFSTGNVYPFVSLNSGGSIESDALAPQGEYANSCLGRERIFEYFSHERGTRCLIFRLNYAVDLRYGVLVDIAQKVFARQPVNLSVAAFNVVWQGDANSYALRSIELCEAPPRILNVTGSEIISTQAAAEFFAQRFQRAAIYQGEPSALALLNNASLCHSLLGDPSITAQTLMEMVAHWIEIGGVSLNKPTKFEVTDGKF